MGKNLKINDTIYNGVESLSIPTGDGGMATFIDEENAGAKLPELTNPVISAALVSGYQAINEDGEVIEGDLVEQASFTFTNYTPGDLTVKAVTLQGNTELESTIIPMYTSKAVAFPGSGTQLIAVDASGYTMFSCTYPSPTNPCYQKNGAPPVFTVIIMPRA